MQPPELALAAGWSAGVRAPLPRRQSVNAPAAVLALGMTGLFLCLLMLSPPRRDAPRAPSPPRPSVMLELWPAWTPAEPPAAASRREARQPSAPTVSTSLASPTPPTPPTPPTQPTQPTQLTLPMPPTVPLPAPSAAVGSAAAQDAPATVAVPAPAPAAASAPRASDGPASAPLKLDVQVLRRAAADGAGTTPAQVAARQAGRAVVESPQQALGAAMARSARPDCISPNEGGSLLLLPKLALDALAGRCK